MFKYYKLFLNLMIKFFKKLLKKEKEIIELNIDEINEFLKEKGYSNCNLNEVSKPFFDDIKLNIEEIKTNLKELEKAQLRNPNIDQKSKQFMEGNRLSYVTKIENFLNSLNIPDDCNKESLKTFISRYKHDVENMNKATIRSFYIVSEFFKDYLQNIASKLKKIDKNVFKLEENLNKDPSVKASEINLLLEEYNEIKDKIDSINSSIQKINDELNSIKEELEKISKKEIAIKNSESYNELSNLLSDKEINKEKLDNEKKIMYDFFSKLEPGFKKLDYIMPQNKIIKKYLDDPVDALIEDKNFEIIDYKNQLITKINSGEIDLKDKKKDNVLIGIELLDLNQIKKFIKSFTDLNNEINQINIKINSLSVGRNLSEIEYKKEHLDQKKKRLFDDILSLEKSLSKYDYTGIINDIQLSLEDLTNSKVIILNDDEGIEKNNVEKNI